MKDQAIKLLACIVFTQLIGCRDDKDKSANQPGVWRPVDGTIPFNQQLGEIDTGNVRLFIPIFLSEGAQQLSIKESYDYIYAGTLTNGTVEVPAKFDTSIAVKACEPGQESEKFLAEWQNWNSQRSEAIAFKEWSSESDSFRGRSFYRMQYQKSDHTKNYRATILLANEKVKECITWSLVVQPAENVSLSYIEGSYEFDTLRRGFERTWQGIGTNFRAE